MSWTILALFYLVWTNFLDLDLVLISRGRLSLVFLLRLLAVLVVHGMLGICSLSLGLKRLSTFLLGL